MKKDIVNGVYIAALTILMVASLASIDAKAAEKIEYAYVISSIAGVSQPEDNSTQINSNVKYTYDADGLLKAVYTNGSLTQKNVYKNGIIPNK